MTKNDIGQRIKEFAEKKYRSVAELTRVLGVDKTYFTPYIKGKSILGGEMLSKLSDLGCDINWLLTGEGEAPLSDEEEVLRKSKISGAMPLYKYPVLAEVYAGPPEFLEVQVISEYKSFEYRAKNHHCFAVKVNGDSMESTLPHGAIALVDMEASIIEDDIVIVKLNNGKQFIKRYHNVTEELIELSSDNPNYANKLIAKKDIEVIYPVVEYIVKPRRRK